MEAEHLASASFTKTTLLPTGLNVSYLLQLYLLLKNRLTVAIFQKGNSLKAGIWMVCHITLHRLFPVLI